MTIIVIIPAFNEERSVGRVVRRVLKSDTSSQCVVIDDGSTDDTTRAAKSAGAHVIRMNRNEGTGAATLTGLRYAARINAGTVILMDADGQHDPRYIRSLLSVLSPPVDMVIGSRYLFPTRTSTSYIRRIGTKIISFLIFLRFGKRIYDPTSGFRAINKKTLRFLAARYPTVFPEPETLLALIKNKYTTKEVSVQMKKRLFGHSSIRPLKAFCLMIYIIVRTIKSKFTD